MNTIRPTLAVAWKELQLIAKDRGSLAVLFVLPLLMGSLFGFINLKLSESEEAAIFVRVTLVNADSGPFGERITEVLTEIKELEIETFGTAAEAEAPVAQGQAAAAVIIPADFTDKIGAYEPTGIEVVVDPGQPQAASIVTGIMNKVIDEVAIWGEVQYGIRSVLEESGALEDASPEMQRAIQAQNLGVIMTTLTEMRQRPLIAVASEDLQGVKVEGGWEQFFALLFPGFTVMFVFFVVGMLASSLLVEREAGTLRRLMASPIERSAIIAGKMGAHIVLVCLQTTVLFAVAAAAFGMPLGRSPLALVVLTLTVALTATSLGMLVAALAKTSRQADSIGSIMGFVLAGVGGAIAFSPTPMTRMGGFMSVVSRLTPHGHAVEGFYRLMAENATFVQVLPQIGVLLAMSLAFFLVARWRFRFE